MGACVSNQFIRKEKKEELTMDLVNGIAAIVNNPKFQSLKKRSTYQRLYYVVLRFSTVAIKNNQQMLDIMSNLDHNANFKASLEILQFRKWSNIMQELQVQSESRTNTIEATEESTRDVSLCDEYSQSLDPLFHDWFRMKCKFNEDECLHYADIFKSNGFDTVESIQQMNDCDLIHVGIQIGDRKIILANITHLIFTLIKQSKQ